MATWDGNNFYYSGQGVVLVGDRSAGGKATNLVPVGNVSALSINVETSVLEHKEAQTGARGIDLRLTTETNASLSMTMENFIADNLRIALRGDITEEAAGSVTGEDIGATIPGGVAPLERIKVSSVVIDNAAASPLTVYVDDATPYDYKVNEDAGSIQLNDGSVQPFDAIADSGTPVTGITQAAQAVVSVANTASVGDYIVITGMGGADAAEVNGIAFEIVAATAADVTIDYDSTAKTLTPGSTVAWFSYESFTADYSYEAQNLVDALVNSAEEKYLRFEGLNTADGNNPVVIEVFKFSVDPLQELALIGDEVQQFVLEGNVLADPLQTTGSKYFKQRLIR